MFQEPLRHHIENLLSKADVVLDGDRPWDPQVHDPRLFRRALAHGSLGIGDAYVEGWWDCDALDELFCRALRGGVDRSFGSLSSALGSLVARAINHQSPKRAWEVGRRHYNLGNDLFQAMLDERMIYSCGYWRYASCLDEAQEAKLDLVCRKLHLKPGMRVLDIGCGWGGAARFAAERYQVEVVGLTVSSEQAALAREHCRGLPVEIRLQDYRALEGHFDRIFSIGMFEHVGAHNHRRFFEVARQHLRPDGLLLLHTIGRLRSGTVGDPWIDHYIFPNSLLPSARQICEAAESLFLVEDWQNFGLDYDTTLCCWHRNFERAWPDLADRYDERFHRLWRYYLLCCAGTFRARRNQLWQVVLAPEGTDAGVYRCER
jgi:cyclopropane-fatty-acyl-phospholipid synthase